MKNRRFNSLSGILFGVLFLCVGGGYLAEALGLVKDFTVFFDGWWTLFIIIPCLAALFTVKGDKTWYLIGLAVGVVLLLSAQKVIDGDRLWAVLLAVLFLSFGINMILPKKKDKE